MIETWLSYNLSDFLMFSAASYFRRYELANIELWPGQLVWLTIGLSLLWSTRRPIQSLKQLQLNAGLVAVSWAFVAGWFFHHHYAQINLAASWFALAFLTQAILLITIMASVFRTSQLNQLTPVQRAPGQLLLIYALFLHPLLGLALGRSWQGIELYGIAPDPTALATLGLLLSGAQTRRWWLLLIPLAWCLVSALTYLAMGLVHGLLPMLLAVIAILATWLIRHSSRP